MANSRYRVYAATAITLLLAAAWLVPSPAQALKDEVDPEHEYVLKAREYLEYITLGDFEAAADITDIRGLGQHITQQRMAFLKNENPEMSGEEELQIIAELRANETSPENIRKVILEMLSEAGTEGMEWQITRITKSEAMPQARIVFCSFRHGEDPARSTPIAVLRVGSDLLIAPQVLEKLRPPPAKAAVNAETPEAVAALGDQFWKYWSEGTLDQAYDLGGENLKQAMPLLKFLETGQAVIDQLGILTRWELLSTRQIKPGYLRAVYNLECTTHTVKGVLDFQQSDTEWELGMLIVPYMGE